ncbi:MAG: class I SAM-dependent methyltransferase, partial [Gammaproteobacteria bacterium]|nr:class I SAM-dependent methyltransferase [Gammaproteobacteria bacterium]
MTTATAAIVEANSLTRTDSGVWVREGEVASEDFRYSDGERAETYLEEVISAASDRSTFSPELERAIIDWPSEYHLSSKRSNLLRILDLGSAQRVLELGCGCGAVSRFL